MTTKEKLFQMAQQARLNSHSPYSEKKVGASLLLDDGSFFSGCNIENASYGGTICAERVAIVKALSEKPGARIQEVVVVTDSDDPWPPCGLCRQSIAEFSIPHKTQVSTGNLSGLKKTFTFEQLLPESFNPSFLKK